MWDKLVGRCTNPLLESPDWGANIECCDLILHSEDHGKGFVKAVRKRLQKNKAKPVVLTLTLTLLETSMKVYSKMFCDLRAFRLVALISVVC